MTPRLNPYNIAPSVMQPMIDLEATVKASGLEADLIELVKTRASQINGCAYCIYMHTRDALAAGEDSARLLLLDAWRESPLYSDRERAALDWTEVQRWLGLSEQARGVDKWIAAGGSRRCE